MKKDFHEDKPLYDITKFTTLDFPENLACIFWFAKCNMRCPYCYNTDIVLSDGKYSKQEMLDFLKTRVGKLTGVVLSGGECTLYPYLKELCAEIQNLSFKIKIDTNGTNPTLIKELVKDKLVDYIALDYKAPKYKFQEITKNKNYDNFEQTLEFLIKTSFSFEVRTTVHADLLEIKDINAIIIDLKKRGYQNTYYLQNFLFVENTLGNISAPSTVINQELFLPGIPIEIRN